MNNFSKLATLAAGVGIVLAVSAPAHAQTFSRFISSNAADKCAAFSARIPDTLRYRVSGVENVGASAIVVACDFPLNLQDSANPGQVTNVSEYFLNGNTVAVDVSCTLLPGDYIRGFGALEGQTINILPGEIGSVSYSGAYDVYAIGLNCTIPSKVIIAHTTLDYITVSPP